MRAAIAARAGRAQESWPHPDENDTGERRDHEHGGYDQGAREVSCLSSCGRVVPCGPDHGDPEQADAEEQDSRKQQSADRRRAASRLAPVATFLRSGFSAELDPTQHSLQADPGQGADEEADTNDARPMKSVE